MPGQRRYISRPGAFLQLGSYSYERITIPYHVTFA